MVALGHEKGLKEGRHAEAIALLLRQATRRYGTLSPEISKRIEMLPLARLEALAEAIFDLNTLSDLLDWLSRT